MAKLSTLAAALNVVPGDLLEQTDHLTDDREAPMEIEASDDAAVVEALALQAGRMVRLATIRATTGWDPSRCRRAMDGAVARSTGGIECYRSGDKVGLRPRTSVISAKQLRKLDERMAAHDGLRAGQAKIAFQVMRFRLGKRKELRVHGNNDEATFRSLVNAGVLRLVGGATRRPDLAEEFWHALAPGLRPDEIPMADVADVSFGGELARNTERLIQARRQKEVARRARRNR